jgi:hypothetical protein
LPGGSRGLGDVYKRQTGESGKHPRASTEVACIMDTI